MWTEGVNYFLIQPARTPVGARGKNRSDRSFLLRLSGVQYFSAHHAQTEAGLPANVVVDYLPAAFNTARGLADVSACLRDGASSRRGPADTRRHVRRGVEGRGPEHYRPATRGLKSRMPTIEDAAKFYNQQAGVPVDKFLATSKSFSADLKVRTDQDLIMGYKIDRTPTIVVNGKYRLHVESAGGNDQLIELVKYLVAKETK